MASGKTRTFQVLISFDGLDKGDLFTQEEHDLSWVSKHVESGYVREVNPEDPLVEPTAEEPTNGAVRQGGSVRGRDQERSA